ncbi:MAG TPA: hypothetical protein PKE27_21000 [Povalibacter sp.]|nr:hypothetical protein [Povalibacter sp.]
MNQFHQLAEHHRLIGSSFAVERVSHIGDFFEVNPFRRAAALLSQRMRGRHIVRHAMYPRTQRTLIPVRRETAPQRHVHVLEQILSMGGVALIGGGDP